MHLRSTGNKDNLQFDIEIERTAKANRKKAKQAKSSQLVNMAAATTGGDVVTVEKTLAEYGVVDRDTCATSITTSAVKAQNFEIKPACNTPNFPSYLIVYYTSFVTKIGTF